MSVQKITMSQNLFLYLKLKICFLSFILAQMTFDLTSMQWRTILNNVPVSGNFKAVEGNGGMGSWQQRGDKTDKVGNMRLTNALGGWQQLLLQNKNLNLETDKCFCKPNQMQICAPATRRKWAVRWASDNVGRKKILFATKLPTSTDRL